MRNLFTIFLILLLLFNVLGYYGVFIGLKYQHTQELTQRFDADNYNEQETITLKVPLAIPYHIDDNDYTRVDGEIEHKGDFYRLIKQKLANDTLYIVCIKDHQSKEIKNALADYVKTFSDKPADAKQQSKTLPGFIKDFIATKISIQHSVDGWNSTLAHTPFQLKAFNCFITITSPPPKA